MRILYAALAMLLVAGEAAALDYHLVQWKKTERCAVLTKLPFFGDHWIELAIFPTRWEAERALKEFQKRGQCPKPLSPDTKAADRPTG